LDIVGIGFHLGYKVTSYDYTISKCGNCLSLRWCLNTETDANGQISSRSDTFHALAHLMNFAHLGPSYSCQ